MSKDTLTIRPDKNRKDLIQMVQNAAKKKNTTVNKFLVDLIYKEAKKMVK